MQMSVWPCGIALFYILFNMSSFFPVYFSVYMPMSASLYHCHLSLYLFGSHWECGSMSGDTLGVCLSVLFCFIFHLTLPFSASEFASKTSLLQPREETWLPRRESGSSIYPSPGARRALQRDLDAFCT